MCKFPLMGCLQIICKNFFAKLVQSVSLCHRLSKKLNFIKIWQMKVGQNKDLVCYRKKQSFKQCAWGLRQLVLKPGLGLKGGLWVCRKRQKISTASDQYFLSYVKKTTGGGVKLTLPPAGIGLTDIQNGHLPLDCIIWLHGTKIIINPQQSISLDSICKVLNITLYLSIHLSSSLIISLILD